MTLCGRRGCNPSINEQAIGSTAQPKVCFLPADEDYLTGTGGSLYDGKQQVLYWADVSSELAIVVPSPETFRLRTMSTSTLESGLFVRHSGIRSVCPAL